MKLDSGRIAAGVWEGVLSEAATAPALQALTGGRVVEGVEVLPVADGRFTVKVPIPSWALNDGIQTFLVQSDGETLARFTLVVGEPLEQDLVAEVGLLRAELDLLKRAFQRHVREG